MKLDETSLLVGGVLGYLWSRPNANLVPLAPDDGFAVLAFEVIGLVIGARFAEDIVDSPSEGMTAVVAGVGWYAGSVVGRMFVSSATYDRNFRRRHDGGAAANPGAPLVAPVPSPAVVPNPRGGGIPPVPAAGITPRT